MFENTTLELLGVPAVMSASSPCWPSNREAGLDLQPHVPEHFGRGVGKSRSLRQTHCEAERSYWYCWALLPYPVLGVPHNPWWNAYLPYLRDEQWLPYACVYFCPRRKYSNAL